MSFTLGVKASTERRFFLRCGSCRLRIEKRNSRLVRQRRNMSPDGRSSSGRRLATLLFHLMERGIGQCYCTFGKRYESLAPKRWSSNGTRSSLKTITFSGKWPMSGTAH